MSEITVDQWEFANSVVSDFKVNIGILAGRENHDDLASHLSGWAIVLGVLALETYESILLLLRAGKLRAAHMLMRPLMEYNIRLRYYVLNTEPLIKGKVRNPSIPEAVFYDQSEAIRDWKNSNAKLADAMKLRLKYLSDEERAEVLKAIDENATLHQHDFRRMCEVVAQGEPELFEWTYGAFGMQSSFLHGDQAIITDVVAGADASRPVVHFSSPSASPMVLLAESSWFFTGMMQSFGRVHGWAYGAVSAEWRGARLFAPTLSAEVAANDAASAGPA